MAKKKDPQIFERITDKQENFIRALCDESIDFDQAKFDSELVSLNGFPSLDGLSKQEASLIIGRLMGKKGPDDTPYWPRKESVIGKGAHRMPTAAQVFSIRESVKSLGWCEMRFKTWLKERTGASHIKTLDRITAQKAVGKLLKLRQLKYTA